VRVSLPRAFVNIAPPLAIIGSTLFLILTGRVYTVEAAGAAAVALTGWALVRRELSPRTLGEITRLVMRISGAMFLLIMGANTFSLVFRGFGGDRLTRELITQSFSSVTIAVPVVFLVLLGFGFFLDALEMLFLVAPIALPPLIVLGGDPLWIAVLFGLTLQTSFLLPPAGYALFFIDNVCRNVAPEITMPTIIRGTRPFAILQGAILALVMLGPALATWLPGR
jgi:TRAP-type mannitol/chloroaromatic compound transport system permease large subunit